MKQIMKAAAAKIVKLQQENDTVRSNLSVHSLELLLLHVQSLCMQAIDVSVSSAALHLCQLAGLVGNQAW